MTKEESSLKENFRIVGVNMAILAGFILVSYFTPLLGLIFGLFGMLMQIIICLVFGISLRQWGWILSGFLVFLTGFLAFELIGSMYWR
jgi:hypothetical protein